MVATIANAADSPFDAPLSRYMVRTVEVATPESSIEEVAALMDACRISGVPIVGAGGALEGVVTRTDLVAVGAFQAGRRPDGPAMPLPHRRAREVMTREPLTISIGATVRHAARMMATHAVHRVFVTKGGHLAGVIGAVDIASAVHDAKAPYELSTIMSSPLAALSPRAPLGSAVDLLDRLHIIALVVVDEGRPIGLFSQLEALAARDLARDTPIDALYDRAIVCLPATTPLHVAAGQVARLDVRRVIVCTHGEAVGIVTALDFARWVAW